MKFCCKKKGYTLAGVTNQIIKKVVREIKREGVFSHTSFTHRQSYIPELPPRSRHWPK